MTALFRNWLQSGQKKATPPAHRALLLVEPLEQRLVLNAGDLDPAFGQGGIAALGTSSTVAVEPGGKIIYFTGDRIERFNANGSVDTTFGINGAVPVNLGIGSGAIAFQANGDIVVGGPMSGGAGIARFSPDGSLDTTFGNGGVEIVPISAGRVPSLVVQSDGKILVGASGDVNTLVNTPSIVVRLNSNGSVDTSFKLSVSLLPDLGQIIEQPDGRILICASEFTSYIDSLQLPPVRIAGYIYRINADGRQDPTWATPMVLPYGSSTPIALLPNGQVLAALEGPNPSANMELEKFDSHGTLDPTFGNAGVDVVAYRNITFFGIGAMLVQPDGSIILEVSTQDVNNRFDPTVALARLNANGTRDFTFGNDGISIPNFGFPPPTSVAGAIAAGLFTETNGEILVAGYVAPFEGPLFSLSKLELAESEITPPNSGSQTQAFVEQVYQNLLGRSADAPGLASWANLLNQGISQIQVALDIESSTEYRTSEVTQLYTKVLNRAPDQAGLAGWVNFLAAGGNIEQVEARFLSSPEYLSTLTTNPITAIYQAVLNRTPDAAGSQAWAQALSHGASIDSVALAIIQSPESAQDQVETLYSNLLQRSPDPGGLAAFTNFLVRGGTFEQAEAIMIGSAEYYALE